MAAHLARAEFSTAARAPAHGGRLPPGPRVAAAWLVAALLAGTAFAGDAAPSGDGGAYRRPPMRVFDLPASGQPPRPVELAADETGPALALRVENVYGGGVAFRLDVEGAEAPFLQLPACRGVGCLWHRAAVGRFAVRVSEGLGAILLRYAHSVGSRYSSEGVWGWSICVVERDDGSDGRSETRVVSCRDTPGDETSIVGAQGLAPKDRWRYFAADTEGEPAHYSDTLPLLRDHDGDGYTDVVLWRRHYRSAPALTEERMTEEERKGEPPDDFEIVREETLLLRFDPPSRAFGDPRPVTLPPPPEAWWLEQPPLGAY